MSKPYQYNVLCDVCGFKMKANQLKKRWDGFMVCEKDWEPRNVLDFYRTRNDAHLLPFTRPDDAGETTWTPTVTGVTGSYTARAQYVVNSNNIVTYRVSFTPTTGSVVGSSVTLSLPTGTVSVDKGGTAFISNGTFLGAVSAAATISVPNFTITYSPLLVLTISGSYTKS